MLTMSELKVAEKRLADLNIIFSEQTDKEQYEHAKERIEALGWLIDRVQELGIENNRYRHAQKRIRIATSWKEEDKDEIILAIKEDLNKAFGGGFRDE